MQIPRGVVSEVPSPRPGERGRRTVEGHHPRDMRRDTCGADRDGGHARPCASARRGGPPVRDTPGGAPDQR